MNPGKFSFLVKEIDVIIGPTGSYIISGWRHANTIDYTACLPFPYIVSFAVKEVDTPIGTPDAI